MKRTVVAAVFCGLTGAAVGQTPSDDGKSNSSASNPEQLQEVVVTGTSIRGAPPTGSQLISLDNAAIVATGATSAKDLLAAIPVLSSFNTSPQGGSINSGTSGGTPPSLHGLPPAATLTLLDGHRLVGDSPLNTYPDPSSIPPGAIDHVEVVADGGSAIYGSDAVAGVINIILKKNYEGAETTGSYGGAGHYNQSNIGQTFGKTWSGGSAMLSATYQNNSDLPNSARDFYRTDLLAFGGKDFRSTSCSPANVQIGTATYASPNLFPGALTKCDPARDADMINQNRRWGLIGTLRQDLGDRVHLFLDAKYTDDKEGEQAAANVVGNATITSANPFFVAPPGTGATSETVLYNTSALGTQTDVFTAKSGMVDGGATVDLFADWAVTSDFDYGWSRSSAFDPSYNSTAYTAALAGTTTATAVDPFGSNTSAAVANNILDYPTLFQSDQKLYDLNVKADGTVVQLPGGKMKLAVGGAFRKEQYSGLNSTGDPAEAGFSSASVSVSRNVTSGYGELLVPIFGADNALPGLYGLNLSGALRYDHYSDFGSTTNPKYAITWSPVQGVSLRASYGHSFHAPQLSDLDAVDTRAIFSANSTLVPPGSPPLNTIILAGGNPNLQPETARTGSFGVDLNPTFLPGLKASIGYFLVRYKNQINVPPLNTQVFINPVLFSRFVIENPTDAQIAQALNGIRLTFAQPTPPIQQILDFDRNNIGATSVDGLDFDAHYDYDLAGGVVTAGIGGSYLTEYETQQSAGATPVDNLKSGQSYVNQVGIVPLHIRGTLGWAQTNFRTQLALNYTGSYKFGYVTTAGSSAVQNVKSFPTVDWYGSYDLPTSGALSGITVGVNVFNMFDQNPPLLLETGGFSAQTANPLGRMFQVSLTKKW